MVIAAADGACRAAADGACRAAADGAPLAAPPPAVFGGATPAAAGSVLGVGSKSPGSRSPKRSARATERRLPNDPPFQPDAPRESLMNSIHHGPG